MIQIIVLIAFYSQVRRSKRCGRWACCCTAACVRPAPLPPMKSEFSSACVSALSFQSNQAADYIQQRKLLHPVVC